MPADITHTVRQLVGIEGGGQRAGPRLHTQMSLGSEREASRIRSACCLTAAGMRRGRKRRCRAPFGEIAIDHEAVDGGERREVR
jgi:hypothetical protein